MRRSRLAALLLLGALVGCGDATLTFGEPTPIPTAAPASASADPAPSASGFALGQELTTASGTRYSSTGLTLPGGRALVLAPATVPPGSEAVLVLALHGAGGSEQTINGFELSATRDALLDRGWLVASAMAYDRGWGNEDSLRDYTALAELVAEHWTVTDVLLHGQSMGAVPAVLLAADARIPDVRAVALVAPALNFDAVWDKGFGDDLEQAYDFQGRERLAAATEGHDPMRLDATSLRGTPIRIWASPQDYLTPKSLHADPFARRMGRSVEVVEVQGDHFGPDHHRPAELIAFYKEAGGG